MPVAAGETLVGEYLDSSGRTFSKIGPVRTLTPTGALRRHPASTRGDLLVAPPVVDRLGCPRSADQSARSAGASWRYSVSGNPSVVETTWIQTWSAPAS